jgi:hypothetical protein
LLRTAGLIRFAYEQLLRVRSSATASSPVGTTVNANRQIDVPRNRANQDLRKKVSTKNRGWNYFPSTYHPHAFLQHIVTIGLHYPLVASRPAFRNFHAIVNRDPNLFPGVDMRKTFANPGNQLMHTAVIIMGDKRFMVIGYFDERVNINVNLLPACPETPWRGELAIFSLGSRIRLLRRPPSKWQAERAAVAYMTNCYQAHAMGESFPAQIIIVRISLYPLYFMTDASAPELAASKFWVELPLNKIYIQLWNISLA